jgi:glutamate/tyrosine decarboxylase-like PLP-dependent enzyme
MAAQLEAHPSVRILNDVVLNQVLVRVQPDGMPDDNADALTQWVIERVQEDGTCWLGGTSWHGMRAIRISVSNWSTTADDIDRSAAAILKAIDG